MDAVYRVFHTNWSEVLDLHKLVEIIPGRLYFGIYSTHRIHSDTASLHFFNFDHVGLKNRPEDVDAKYVFEPLDVGCLTDYIRCLNDKIYNRQYEFKIIVHYTANECSKYNNAALLIGAYAITVRQMSPQSVHAMLKNDDYDVDESSIFGYGRNSIDLYDCLNVIHKAAKYKIVEFDDFSCQAYYSCEFTWIVPNKFIAFRGPIEDRRKNMNYYVKYFRNNNVKTVIRLNRKEYDSSWFTVVGIKHVDLYFEDGSTPSDEILQTFLDISEHTPDAIAVHCKAGLGRTGTLIAAYLIQHFRVTAREAIAWMRMCRPGSIMGAQQSYLMDKENMLRERGDALRKQKYGNVAQLSYCVGGIYSIKSRSELSDRHVVNCGQYRRTASSR